MFYLIYKITNNINNKIYVGSHKTKNKDDGYMGSGKYLNHAIQKYGIENFTKEILFVFDNPKDMYDKEAEIVNDDFLAEENTYNLKRGGFGGFDYINSYGLTARIPWTDAARVKAMESRALITSDEWSTIQKEKCERYSKDEKKLWTLAARDAALTNDVKEKRKTTLKKINHQQGHLNSQFGTCWITNNGINKKIKYTELDNFISLGWSKGRTGRH